MSRGTVELDYRRKNSRSMSIFLFHQHGFDRQLYNFHRQHARRVATNIIRPLGKHHAADAGAPGSPGLNLDDHFAGQFPGCRHGPRQWLRRRDPAGL
jgi:hypothetical protein